MASERDEKSFSESLPVFNFQASMSAWATSNRSTSSSWLISKEKKPTGTLFCTAAFWAMFKARLVFPTPGRAARINKLLRCMPAKTLFKSLKPVGTPRKPPACLWSSSRRSNDWARASLIGINWRCKCCWDRPKTNFSASSRISVTALFSLKAFSTKREPAEINSLLVARFLTILA